MPYLSIIIPAYNESGRIVKTLESILNYLKNKKFEAEIIVVDDGSTDTTKTVIEKFGSDIRLLSNGVNPHIYLISVGVNRGKGYAVKQGMLAAKGEWVLMTDADLSTPIEELDRFLARDGCEVLIASRALRGSRILTHQPFYRELGGKLINFFVRLIALPGVSDTQCGFKLFRGEAARNIFERLTIDGFGFDIETLYIARKLGFKIIELPVVWSNSPNTKVHPLRDGLRILNDLVIIRKNNLKGVYE